MTQSEKGGFVGEIIGVTIGGLAWLVVAGISIKSPLLVILTMVAGIIGVFGAIKLYNLNPKRKNSIIGSELLWVIIFSMISINIIYGKIPEIIFGISTGKNQISLRSLNIFLGVISLLGFYYIIKDILRKKDI